MDLTQTACTMAPVRQGAFIYYADHLTNRSTTSRFATCPGEMQGAALDGPSGRLRPSGDGGATGLLVAGFHAGFTKQRWINQSFAIHGVRGFISSMTC
jgi:hypothetical protein